MADSLTWVAQQFAAARNISVGTLNGWIESFGKTGVPEPTQHDATGPVTTGPVTTGPVTTEPVTTEPVTTTPKATASETTETETTETPETVKQAASQEPEPPLDPQAEQRKKFEAAYAPVRPRRDLAVGVDAPTQWTSKAKQTLIAADTALQKHVTEGAFDQALLALPTTVDALDALDAAARKELENDLALLDGWPEAKGGAATLRGRLDKLGQSPASLLADPGYAAVAKDIKASARDWSAVRRHNAEVAKLKLELAAITEVSGSWNPFSGLKAEWDAYKQAKAKLPDPATTTADADKLTGLRDTFSATGRALCRAYESGKAGAASDSYYEVARRNLSKTTVVLFRTALKVPPKTPEIVALQRDVQVNQAKARTGSAKTGYESLQAAAEAARKVIPMRTQAPDPAAVAFQAKWGPAEKPIAAILAGLDPSLPAQDLAALEVNRDKIRAELAKKDACDYAECERLLAGLNSRVEPLLGALTGAVSLSLDGMKALPAGNATQKGAKAERARSLIDLTHPVLLARLDAKQHCDLMDGLRTTEIPNFNGSNKGDPKRVAMRKLYASMSLDTAFMAKDDESRSAMIEALKAKKQELKDAKANWSSMSNEQKLALMKTLADQQCASFKFPLPKDGFQAFNDPASTNNGSYSPGDLADDPPDDKISVNTAQPVFHDFEAALDLVFHENGHKYQSTLVRALRNPKGTPPWLTETNTDPPYTQGRLFDLGNHDGCYVKGAEDYEIYKKQPEEDHAWTIGPRSAQMLLDMLNQPD